MNILCSGATSKSQHNVISQKTCLLYHKALPWFAGVKAAAYHAGLKDAQRSEVLQQWSCGQIPVVAATIAFGMGIDRACARLGLL